MLCGHRLMKPSNILGLSFERKKREKRVCWMKWLWEPWLKCFSSTSRDIISHRKRWRTKEMKVNRGNDQNEGVFHHLYSQNIVVFPANGRVSVLLHHEVSWSILKWDQSLVRNSNKKAIPKMSQMRKDAVFWARNKIVNCVMSSPWSNLFPLLLSFEWLFGLPFLLR